jgi:hypothetical protein
MEIEESGIKPAKICGKYLTTALSSQYNYKDKELIKIEKKSVIFIQVLGIRSSKPDGRKEQFSYIENEIRNNLCGCIKEYDIITIDMNNEKDSDNLRNELYRILKKNKVIEV